MMMLCIADVVHCCRSWFMCISWKVCSNTPKYDYIYFRPDYDDACVKVV